MQFKENFIWGAATSAYQIEGSFDTDGRGLSVWDAFCEKRGVIHGGHTGKVACDHYNRYREDVAIMASMKLQAYRFSFSWSRILPEGVGRVSVKGLEFYDRLIDTLLEHDIAPYATLFHWDFPQELYVRGGWLNPESPNWFAEYTSVVADRFSDRVSDWFTLNEPPCFLGLGHVDGTHAPGLKLDWSDFFLATKHALMAHGRSVQVLREKCKKTPNIGYAPISHIAIPVDESPENIRAAEEFTFGTQDAARGFWFARLYLDPVLKGEWPEDAVAVLCKNGPKVSNADLAVMNQPIDMLGLNFYAAPTVRAGAEGKPEVVAENPGSPRTGFDWSITPEGLYWSVRFHHERYGLPVVISENGLSSLDWVHEDGKVHDPQRIDYTSRYLKSLHRAHAEGYAVDGYFHWSLLDNFEWAEGFKHRFGMVHVDFATQRRTLKDSAHWYRTVVESNGAALASNPVKNAVVVVETSEGKISTPYKC